MTCDGSVWAQRLKARNRVGKVRCAHRAEACRESRRRPERCRRNIHCPSARDRLRQRFATGWSRPPRRQRRCVGEPKLLRERPDRGRFQRRSGRCRQAVSSGAIAAFGFAMTACNPGRIDTSIEPWLSAGRTSAARAEITCYVVVTSLTLLVTRFTARASLHCGTT